MAEAESGVAAPLVQNLLNVPASWPATLMVVIDTEEEFDWGAPFNPSSTAVSNIALQPLAQAVFDAYGVIPTYVIDYPVASDPHAAAVLGEIAADGRCEIGAHLHPWVNPPLEGPVDARHSYPGNLPATLERRKLAVLTDTIAAGFGARPTVYKAGRYGIGMATAATLRALGYKVDVSVVPHTDFSADGGPDFRGAPDAPYRFGDGLSELPLSVHFVGRLASQGPWVFRSFSGNLARKLHVIGVLNRLGLLSRLRLTPEGSSLTEMRLQTRAALAAGTRLFMLTYHSSSLLPGATRYVSSETERGTFLRTLDGYLQFFLSELGGRADTVTRVAAALTPG